MCLISLSVNRITDLYPLQINNNLHIRRIAHNDPWGRNLREDVTSTIIAIYGEKIAPGRHQLTRTPYCTGYCWFQNVEQRADPNWPGRVTVRRRVPMSPVCASGTTPPRCRAPSVLRGHLPSPWPVT